MATISKTSGKRKVKRRTKAQVETDKRLAALRKNLAAEIEADLGRFAGDSRSPMAGLVALTRIRILLAFLQAFFPMFIRPPKPRKVVKKTARRRSATKRAAGKRSGSKGSKTVRSKRAPNKNVYSEGGVPRKTEVPDNSNQPFSTHAPSVNIAQGFSTPRVLSSAASVTSEVAAKVNGIKLKTRQTARAPKVKVIDIAQS